MNLRKLPAAVVRAIARPLVALPWREISIDLVGLGSVALVGSGVYVLWGLGWTLITAGTPLFGWYVWREYLLARRARRA